MAPTDRLAVLPFLQSWTGSQLQLRVLLIPRDSFIEPFVRSNPQSPEYFPAAQLAFDVFVQPGLETIPVLGGGTKLKTEPFAPLDTAKQIFAEILAQEDPSSTPKARPGGTSDGLRVSKHLPVSYRAAEGDSPGFGLNDDLFSTDNQYSCALKQMARPIKYEPISVPAKKSWGQMISGLLRNARFAELAGLLRAVTVDILPTQLDIIRNGGFVYLLPQPGSTAASGGCEVYSARIPALAAGPRELFTPVLFPIVPALVGSDYDDIFAEAEDFSDGWAKVVHCRQPQRAPVVKEDDEGGTGRPGQEEEDDGDDGGDDSQAQSEVPGSRPATELGIQIGWDDRQVTVWMDRQMDSGNDKLQTGLGVRGYRIDARFAGEGDDRWRSLTVANGSYGVGRFRRDDFSGDSAVEVYPSASIDKDVTPRFWMPMYFSTWTGPALVGLDSDRMVISGRRADADGDAPKLVGVTPSNLPLLYGKDYEFRVRLADQTGGGPGLTSRPINPAAHPVSMIPFRRWIRPLAPLLQTEIPQLTPPREDQDDRAPLSLSFKRPGLQYPAVQCTGHYADAAKMLRDKIEASRETEPTLADPDVDRLEITVQVQTLAQDTLVVEGTFRDLYTTTRTFSSEMDAPLDLTFNWVECHDVDHPETAPPTDTDPWKSKVLSGPLGLPKSRSVRLCVRALCKNDEALAYFGDQDVRRSVDVKVTLRKNAAKETSLFTNTSPNERFNAYFLQPETQEQVASSDSGTDKPATPISRLATEVGLRNDGNILRSPPGRRVVFACSAGLRHAIGPDGASLNLMGTVTRLWLVVIKLTVDRDWTWDGFVHNSIAVQRVIGTGAGANPAPATTEVARFSPSRNVNRDALSGPDIIRAGTDLVIVDALDPLQIKSASGFPEEIRATYTLSWKIVSAGPGAGITPTDSPLEFPIRLPVTTAPTQQPRLVSAGIALSPYITQGRYSSTVPRTRMLWIELAEPPLDPGDRYFARVLAQAPDPLLQLPDAPPLALRTETALPIDPEPLRRVTEASSDDRAGLDAMQPLVPSISDGGEGGTTTGAAAGGNATQYWGLPLPPGISEDSPELLGLWTYELRVGHYSPTQVTAGGGGEVARQRWCTAQGRFGPPLRVAGVQHPAPPLPCAAYRPDPTDGTGVAVEASAPLAAIAYKWQPTSLWFLLYAQAELLDGSGGRRNVLLLRRPAASYTTRLERRADLAGGFGVAQFAAADVRRALDMLGFTASQVPLSVLAVEMLQPPQQAEKTDPLGYGLGSVRILRSSALVEVKSRC